MQSNKLSIGNEGHVQAYLQYCSMVGDNGGKLMSQKQFQEYKLNYDKMLSNRLYTSWYNSSALECKVVGPSTKCFCSHFYKNHDYLEGKPGKVKCKANGCKCNNYDYIPIYGSQDFKCHCKHSFELHDVNKRNCKSCNCKAFVSNWSCPCGDKYSAHTTVSQNKQAKQSKQEVVHPINGGIVAYSSMLDGADKFQYGLKEEMKQKGIKVKIEQLVVSKLPKIMNGQVSAWQLYNKPISWLK